MLSLTYVSSTKELLSVPQLVELLESIRPKNDELELTGMLLYSGGNVIQTLEGPDESVERVFASIETDPRHTGILVLLREQVERRAFPRWSMGFRNLSEREDLGDGLGDQSSSAHRLLELFRANMR